MGENELTTRTFIKLPNGQVKCDRSCEVDGKFENLVKLSDGKKVCITNEGQELTRGLGISFEMSIPCLRGVCALYEEKRKEEQK